MNEAHAKSYLQTKFYVIYSWICILLKFHWFDINLQNNGKVMLARLKIEKENTKLFRNLLR